MSRDSERMVQLSAADCKKNQFVDKLILVLEASDRSQPSLSSTGVECVHFSLDTKNDFP
jgi:hypothetical protein